MKIFQRNIEIVSAVKHAALQVDLSLDARISQYVRRRMVARLVVQKGVLDRLAQA
jgi:hypothetical protein